MIRRLRRWRMTIRARLGLRPKPRREPCEVCGRIPRRPVVVTATESYVDPELGTGLGGFALSATYCRAHAPKETSDAAA